jgi:dCMP deaminase
VIKMSSRIDKTNYYLDIAETVTERATCLRRCWGAVIVKNDEIISTGYNGAPRGRKNCTDVGYCIREKLNVPRGERYELCRSVHAEQNAIISASRRDTIGATLYIVGVDSKTRKYVEKSMPCAMCKRTIINSGIEKVVIRDTKKKYREINVQEFIDNDESLDGSMGY